MDLKEMIFDLSDAVAVGGITEAVSAADGYLSKYATTEIFAETGLIGIIKGKCGHTVMFDAHIDEIAMMVTFVSKNGFIRVAAAGGIDSRMLAAMPVVIHAEKGEVPGVFCSTPPHLSKDDGVLKIDEMYIDSMLGDKACDFISVGDRITFSQKAAELSNGKITGKSLDNRAGVAAIIEAARLISEEGTPPCNVAFLLSDQEELGCRGAKTASFSIEPQEAIVVDVSFGDTPDIPSYKTGKLGDGAMIGISPILSPKISNRLKNLGQSLEIPFQPEVMGGATSTNADVISISKDGIPCGLISIPLRNMHTPAEVISIEDVKSVAKLLAAYVLSYGKENGHD